MFGHLWELLGKNLNLAIKHGETFGCDHGHHMISLCWIFPDLANGDSTTLILGRGALQESLASKVTLLTLDDDIG